MARHRFASAPIVALALGAAAATVGSDLGPAAAEPAGTPAPHNAHGHATQRDDQHSPYADRFNPTAAIRSLTAE